MFKMYFLCPTIFFIFTITFPLAINEKIPQWMQLDIGQIHAEDIRKMSSENRNYLRKKVMFYFGLAFIIMLVVSTLFYIFTDTSSIMSLMICNVLCLTIGISTVALPITKITRELKRKLTDYKYTS